MLSFFLLVSSHPSDETTQIPLDRNEKHISIKTGSRVDGMDAMVGIVEMN